MDWLDEVRWDPQGLIPVIAQEASSGDVLMFAWMDRDALRQTAETGRAVYFSRSRKKLWFKGETSGETFDLLEAYVNCEQNSLLYIVRPCRGGICHTKNKTGSPRNCYYRKIDFETLKREFGGEATTAGR